MEKQEFRIVYMGTPEFAVAPLEALVSAGFNVVGVVTGPDKPVGRHQSNLTPCAVKQCALRLGLPVLQPEKLSDPQFLQALTDWRPTLQVVVAFRILPREVWALPPMGTFNLHASLLPRYRGAAPINWAIIRGDRQTGVTTFLLQQGVDVGLIIEQATVSILPDDDAGSLALRLQDVGARLVVSTTRLLFEGHAQPRPQQGEATLAPKIFKETGHIDWANHTADQIHNLVRGLSPHPGTWTTLHAPAEADRPLKIFRTAPATGPEAPALPVNATPGGLCAAGKQQSRLFVACAGGTWLEMLEVQPAGRRRMGATDFLRGLKNPENWQAR